MWRLFLMDNYIAIKETDTKFTYFSGFEDANLMKLYCSVCLQKVWFYSTIQGIMLSDII